MAIRRAIRVFIVDDSILFRETMAREMSRDPGIEVVGEAGSAKEAKALLETLTPDVMTLDVEMPGQSGVDFVRELMSENPMPVVMVSSLSDAVFDAMSSGAVDFVVKPGTLGRSGMDSFINELLIKVKIASTAKVGRLRQAAPAAAQPAAAAKENTLIVLGASTGGTEATASVMRCLPHDLPGIVIVQHMPPVFTRMYAERLNNISKVEVREAADGDRIRPGLALVAPGSFQLQVKRDSEGFFVHTYEAEKVNGHAPSVDVLFLSAAKAAGANAVGLILTGMGNDGAKGLLEMRQQGAFTIGQDEKSCVVYGMPKVAYDIGAVERQCPLESIPGELLAYLGKKGLL